MHSLTTTMECEVIDNIPFKGDSYLTISMWIYPLLCRLVAINDDDDEIECEWQMFWDFKPTPIFIIPHN